MRRTSITVALAITMCALARAAQAPARRPALPPAAEIRARAAAVGPMNVVAELAGPTPEAGSWPELLSKVETGSSEWLAVAEALAPGTDAGLSLQLRFAVTHALAKAPSNVMKILGHVYDAAEVCGDENVFMDNETYEAASDKLRRWTEAVKGVSEPRLAQNRTACLQGLARLGRELQRNKTKWFAN